MKIQMGESGGNFANLGKLNELKLQLDTIAINDLQVRIRKLSSLPVHLESDQNYILEFGPEGYSIYGTITGIQGFQLVGSERLKALEIEQLKDKTVITYLDGDETIRINIHSKPFETSKGGLYRESKRTPSYSREPSESGRGRAGEG